MKVYLVETRSVDGDWFPFSNLYFSREDAERSIRWRTASDRKAKRDFGMAEHEYRVRAYKRVEE